jgi:signal transduction histidine kinase
MTIATQELLVASRQAGMAEVASGVLHNVGNVLNSVNVSANVIADNLRTSKLPYLAKSALLLDEHAHDLAAFLTQDPKGQHLRVYLSRLAERLGTEQAELMREVESLRKDVEHIANIVAMQQEFAKTSGMTERFVLSRLIEDSLRMSATAVTNHRIQIIREYREDGPELVTDKHKVLQILVNLIRNAIRALVECERPDKLLTLRIQESEGRVLIVVSDNGIGIPPETLPRIFTHGFTTRQDGHGFGLHSGALAAKALGGSLLAQSDGADCGATFTLELPLRRPDRPRPEESLLSGGNLDEASGELKAELVGRV